MRRDRLFIALAAAIFLVVTLGLLEGAVRVATAVNPGLREALHELDPMAVQIEPHGTHGYRQKPFAQFHYANGTTANANSLRYRGPEVSPEPAPGTVRIILLGGSTTHGFGVPDNQTIDAYMRSIFQERYPTRHFEVVNLALDGYDTFQLLERLKSDGLRLHPTVVVMHEGINDVRNAGFANLKDQDPRTMFWEAVLTRLRYEQAHGGPSLWSRMKHYLVMLRIPGYIRQQLETRREGNARLRGGDPSAKANTSFDSVSGRNEPPYPEAADYFERNVRTIVDLSLADSAAVLLSTPPSALRWTDSTAKSTRSYWVVNAGITQHYRDDLAHRLQKVASDYSARGQPVAYVAPEAPKTSYLDDCHLDSAGNKAIAAAWVDAIMPLLDARNAPHGIASSR